MSFSKETLQTLTSGAFLPQEEMLEVARKKGSLYIGIPCERSFQEHRVALLPEDVKFLTNNGHRIVVETGAGSGASYQDNDYSEAGAEIVYDTQEVFKADIILKVAPPTLEEIDYMTRKQTLISALQITVQPKDFLKKLIQKKVTAIAWDYLQDEEGIYSIVRSMGEIAGTTSVLIAAELLSNTNGGTGLMLGGITGVAPTEVVILGAGTVGEYAVRSALGLGASVKVFDDSVYKLRRLQNAIGQRIYTSTISQERLSEALKNADVAIGAIRATKGIVPCIVTEEMVKNMKYGSVIVDVSIDQGGVFETSEVTTHDHPTYIKYGVIHYCVPNIPSRVARTSSGALSNIFSQILFAIGEEGGVEGTIRKDRALRSGVYLYNGILTNEHLSKKFHLPFKDLNLLIAALD
ncbi:MAG: alanine dehydrogenase [Bacteroidetes bacterium]|nr:MAG: alanine dehydrogenase [Bacteroidota bacterium]